MATEVINGCTIHYEILGSGQPIVFTPGGKGGMNIMRPVAERMAPHYQVIIYDRRNCGASDIVIGGELSEQEIWADDLAQLIKQLGLAPAYSGGWSAGCRVSLLLAMRHPEVVKGLLLGWVTGGQYAADHLAYNYYGEFIEAAERGGMPAVLQTAFFAERIVQNPANRDRLLAMDVQEFINVMSRWRTFFTEGADLPVIGATEEQLASIRVPTMIVAGDDDIHTLTAAQNLHWLLLNSEYHDPVLAREEWNTLYGGPPERLAKIRGERAAPIFLEFLERMESRQPVAGN